VCLAHCVAVDEDEIAAIGRSGVGVAHCPRSNAFLGVGTAPIREFADAGAPVGLGTDGAGSCGRLDFGEEMRFALSLARARGKDAGVMTAKDMLQMATQGGARVLGLEDRVGRLEAGMRADMVAIDMSTKLPEEDIYLAALNSSPRDVVLTVVDGVEVVRDGRLVRADIDELRAELKDALGSLTVG
jgi:cytosine/adenosine deaminase-related metal-dependent hydrolase